MTSKTFIAAILVICCFIFSCDKDETALDSENPSFADSVALLRGNWKVVKDSLTNTGNYYFMENGTAWYPTPGVYFGTAADYWEFFANDTLAIHENQQSYKSKYQFLSNNQLIVQGLLVHGNGTVITLTTTAATFDWSATSSNGGKFFRRVYLKK